MFQPFEITENKFENQKAFLDNLELLLPPGKCNSRIEEISILANTVAFLNWYLKEINWVGFYLLQSDELIVGPFQGLPACSPIKVGNGVCGKAIEENKPIIVKDVDKFPGHIACDSNSKSEIVIPFSTSVGLYGLLDIDSPKKNRFNSDDLSFLTNVCKIITKRIS